MDIFYETEADERYLHYSMSMVGGIIGGCAVAVHLQFGSAQTNNILMIIMAVVGSDLFEVLLRVGALAIYIGGLVSSTIIRKKCKGDLRGAVIGGELIMILLLGILPSPSNHFIALYPFFLISSVQWSFFAGVKNYNCSSIFATNNLRVCVTELTEYFCSGESHHLSKSRFYFYSLFWFFAGVTSAALLAAVFSGRSILIGILPLGFALEKVFSIKKDTIKKCHENVKINLT